MVEHCMLSINHDLFSIARLNIIYLTQRLNNNMISIILA